MSLKEHFIRKLRNRVWKNSRAIIRLRRRALDADRHARYGLHDEIDELKFAREHDILKIEDICQEGDGFLEEVKVGVEEVVDGIQHLREDTSPENR